MKKFSLFLFLVVALLGTATIGYVFYAYHVVQDEQGIHFLKKDKAELQIEIVDTRDWKVTDWLKNSDISKGMTKLRWENFRNEAEATWSNLRDSVSEAFEDVQAEDTWSEDIAEEWRDIEASMAAKYEDLKDAWKDGKLDREAFDSKVEDLRKWAERQVEELQDRLSQ